MPSFIGLAVLTAVLCGGAWGWRVGTRRLYRRSYFDDDNRGGRVPAPPHSPSLLDRPLSTGC